MIENLVPKQAWVFMQQHPVSVLVDVRTKLEYNFVGHPLGAINIALREAPEWQYNPKFVDQLRKAVPDEGTPVLLICRSGQRSFEAAKLLETKGYRHLINILDGFEGGVDENKQRGNLGGWRFYDLPWEQS